MLNLQKQSFSSNKKLENDNFLSKENKKPEFSYYSTIKNYFNLFNFFQNTNKKSSSDDDQGSYFTANSNSLTSLNNNLNNKFENNQSIKKKKLLNDQNTNSSINLLNTKIDENNLTKLIFDNQNLIDKKKMSGSNLVSLNTKPSVINLNQELKNNSTLSLNSIHSLKSITSNDILPLNTLNNDTASAIKTSELILTNKSLFFSDSENLNKKTFLQNFVNSSINYKNKMYLLNSSKVSTVPSINYQSAFLNNKNKKYSIASISVSNNNNSGKKIRNGLQQKPLETIKLQDNIESRFLEPLHRFKVLLYLYVHKFLCFYWFCFFLKKN